MPTSRPEAGLARWIKEPYCGISHGSGAVLSVIALVVMLICTRGGAYSYVSLSIYGGCMIAVFTSSALAHSLHVRESVSDRLDRIDYACIFLMIAGTYTPLCLTALRGPWGYTILTIEGACALLGAGLILLTRLNPDRVSPLFIPMGWLIIVAIVPVFRLMPLSAILWLVGGGMVYTVGAIIFITERPRLWPGRFGWHDLWHSLVLAAAACHFVAVTRVAM